MTRRRLSRPRCAGATWRTGGDGRAGPPWCHRRIAGRATAKSALPALSGLTRAWSPLMVLGLCFRRTRRSAALALLAPAINDWVARPGDLDPARYATLHVADDLSYGAGVWLGCLRSRTLRPLIPKISVRARVWSPQSLRTQLGGAEDQGNPTTTGQV